MGGTVITAPDFDFDLSTLTRLSRFASPDHRPNMLIVCTEAGRQSTTRHVAEWCQSPVHVCRLPGFLNLPATCGTLIVSDPAAMQINQQLSLYDWIDRHQDTRIISITSADLPALIRQALFLDGLYYRLNTIRVDGTLTPYDRKSN